MIIIPILWHKQFYIHGTVKISGTQGCCDSNLTIVALTDASKILVSHTSRMLALLPVSNLIKKNIDAFPLSSQQLDTSVENFLHQPGIIPGRSGEHVVEILSAEFFKHIAHKVASSSALRTFKKSLNISHNQMVAIMSLRSENLGELLQKLREPFRSSS